MLERIGKYEIRLEIGRGAMGIVYEGFDPVIGRRVAIKTLRTEMFEPSQLPEVFARFRREAQSAGNLSHPHIVTIHDYGEEQGTPYIVMEYMSGDELGDQLERGSRLTPDEVVRIMTALLGALTHAHEHGVIHRDLKPSNMFVMNDGSLKVVDFGIARVETSDLTDSGTMLGTPAYMSPEQFLTLPVDARSDLYSAGVILYQLLTGDKPFTGSITAIMQKVLHQQPIEPSVLNPTLSTAWDAVVSRAMAKKPEARYETARQFLEAVIAAHAAERDRLGAPWSKTVRLERAPGEAEWTAPALQGPDPVATVLVPPEPEEGRSGKTAEPQRSRKGLAVAAAFLAALGVAAALLYPLGDSPDLAAIWRARQDAERRAADAEPRARKETEPAKREAEPRTKPEAARDEDPRREADAARKVEEAHEAEKSRAEQGPREAHKPGTVFRDCTDCPQMVVIPAGEFTMGSPASEAGRFDHEGPQRAVRIAQPFALGQNEITFAEFERFVEDAGNKTEAERDAGKQGCFGFTFPDRTATKSDWQPGKSWRDPGFEQTGDRDPVVCVSWNDAKAYIRWLSRNTGKIYRLPTEAEWEYAARAGTSAARYWGDDPNQACLHENVADRSTYKTGGAPSARTWSRRSGARHECNDGRYFTAPVGSYRANAFGLYDMLGNVLEWTEDCWTAAPADGLAWLTGDCSRRVVRGGSWTLEPRYARSANRARQPADFRRADIGFRLARTLE